MQSVGETFKYCNMEKQVKSYKRRTKSGKVVTVKSYSAKCRTTGKGKKKASFSDGGVPYGGELRSKRSKKA